ncbi:MAG: DNA mismatch endonuclease Vsr [Bacteroidota bacterium]|nr:DNA mismatch endonuclease Vsr [Bacteroidota bacterium]
MADVHSKETRSYNMSRIRSKDTKPEMLVRKFLHKNGFRYRLHVKDLPGKPDIVLPKYKTVIFIHGCFWHGHEGCKYATIPKTRTDWWQSKIAGNKQNEIKNKVKLKSTGWKVLVVYTCNLKYASVTSTLNELKISIRPSAENKH